MPFLPPNQQRQSTDSSHKNKTEAQLYCKHDGIVPSKPVQASLYGSIEIALVSVHDEQHSRIAAGPAAIAIVYDGTSQRHDAIVRRNVSTSAHDSNVRLFILC